MSLHEELYGWASSVWPWLLNHLWHSTIFVLLVYIGAVLLVRGSARSRYVIWLSCSVKILLPSSLVALLLEKADADWFSIFRSTVEPVQNIPAITPFAAPILELPQSVITNIEVTHGHNEIYCLLSVIWLVGFVGLVVAGFKKRLNLSSFLMQAKEADSGRERETLIRVMCLVNIKRDINLKLMPGNVAPGVRGVWKPVLILPESIFDCLSDAEFEAIVVHEMIHVKRWDNLISALQGFLCCLLWFYPFVWLINRKLYVERERACDEEVIRLSGASEIYASSILKVCRFCIVTRMAGVSTIAGSDLVRRVERIMANNGSRTLAKSHRVLTAAAFVGVLVFTLALSSINGNNALSQKAYGQAGTPVTGLQAPTGSSEGVNGSDDASEPLSHVARGQETMEMISDIPIEFAGLDTPLLTINEARIKVFKRAAKSAVPVAGNPASNDRVVRPVITFVNNSTQRITRIALRVTSPQMDEQYYLEHRRPAIEPNASLTAQLGELVSLPREIDIRRMKLQVIGIRLADKTEVGRFEPGLAGSAQGPPDSRVDGAYAPSGTPPGQMDKILAPKDGDMDAPGSSPPFTGAPRYYGDKNVRIIYYDAQRLLQAVTKRVDPDFASIERKGSRVVVETIVDENGNVESARVVSKTGADPAMEKAAIEAVRQWKFDPAAGPGGRAKIVGNVTFRF
jgi:TonB family protein